MPLQELLTGTFVYLAAAVVAAPLFARLGLGSVLGYLAAGIVIGPSVLGLTGEAADVMSFAEFGITVMLFLVGLELQPDKLWGSPQTHLRPRHVASRADGSRAAAPGRA